MRQENMLCKVLLLSTLMKTPSGEPEGKESFQDDNKWHQQTCKCDYVSKWAKCCTLLEDSSFRTN